MTMAGGQMSVSFSVPEKIIEGLRTGEFERVGGVIRHASKSGSENAGQVVAWLRESPQLAELTQGAAQASKAVPAAVAQQLDAIGAGIQVVAGLQLLTFGVTVAGFRMIAARLQALDKKLDLILSEIGELRSDVAWIIKRADVETLALVAAAVESARLAELTLPVGDVAAEYRFARRELTMGRVQLAALTNLLIREDQIWRRPEVFALYAQLFLSTLAAEVRTSLLLGNYETAIEVTRAGQLTIEETLAVYRGRLGSPLTAIQEGRTADLDTSTVLGQGKAIFEESLLRLEGHASELKYLRASGTSFGDWEALAKNTDEPAIVCIEPKRPELAA